MPCSAAGWGVDPASSSSVDVTIAADSFSSRDEQRDTHVRSADFLDVEHFPTLSFVSTDVRQDGGDWVVTGDLTVHGVTRSVELATGFEGAIDDPYGMERIAFSAETEIDRTEFGLTWNQALETGGLVVGRKVKVSLEVEAVRPKA
jgi:polyisoprenoid-binding protein YceI